MEASVCFCSAHGQQCEFGAGWSLRDCRKGSFPAHSLLILSVSRCVSDLRGSAGRSGLGCNLSHLSSVFTSFFSTPRLHHEASASSLGAVDTQIFISQTVLYASNGSPCMWFIFPSWLTLVHAETCIHIPILLMQALHASFMLFHR